MHRNGYLAGVYGSPININNDMGPGAVANIPDQIWASSTSGSTTNPIPYLNNGWWVNNQRTRQYVLNYKGPYFTPANTVVIDLDNLDAATTIWANVGQYCAPVCSNPCNPSCPDYSPGYPGCGGGEQCDCYSCTNPEGGCPECCQSVCNLQCGG